MTHTISKDVFKEQMQRLASAFIKKPTKVTLKIYWEKLNDISEANFKKIVENIIDQDSFFPSIARFRQTSKQSKSNNVDPLGETATHLSLNLSINDDLEEWKTRYRDLTDRMARASIWPEGHMVDKDSVLRSLIKLQEWRNNANWYDFPCYWLGESTVKKIQTNPNESFPDGATINLGNCSIGRAVGTLPIICESYILWVESEMRDGDSGEKKWLSNGIQEHSLFPKSKMFQLFIEQLSRDISPYIGAYSIQSRGWGAWEDEKMETLDEREERKKQELQERIRIKRQKEADEEMKKQNTIWIDDYMEKHLSDYGKSNPDVFSKSVEKWADRKDNWKPEFEDLVKHVEIKHLEHPERRNHAYYFLLRRAE